MLNTDQHNPQVKRRMVVSDWHRNNRGINDGKDFDEDMLTKIYEDINKREIVMPEEVANEREIVGMAWSQLMKKYSSYEGKSIVKLETEKYLFGLITLIFNPLLQCLLPTDTHDHIANINPAGGSAAAIHGNVRTEEMSRIAFSGIELVAKVLGDLELHPLLSELIEGVWNSSGISALINLGTKDRQVTSRIREMIARSIQCRRVLTSLFIIFQSNGPNLRTGWRTFVKALSAFAEAELLSLEMIDPAIKESNTLKRASTSQVSTTTVANSSNTNTSGATSYSIFSTFSSYLISNPSVSATKEPAVVIDAADMENKRLAIRVIQEVCQLERILRDTQVFHEESLAALFQALSQSQVVYLSNMPLSSTGVSSPITATAVPPKDEDWEEPSIVLLEILIYIAWQNRDRLGLFWGTLSSTLSELAKAGRASKLLAEHAVLGLGRICLWISERGQIVVKLVYIIASKSNPHHFYGLSRMFVNLPWNISRF
jgi:brefeldin A-resistance guanine nucleotide exchange factor 1